MFELLAILKRDTDANKLPMGEGGGGGGGAKLRNVK